MSPPSAVPASAPPRGGWPAGVPPLVVVVGPTASGKSDLGVALALALDGEVVGADASQRYRGMDVGTAKLPPAARRGVPHHQVDVLDVRDESSVAAYQQAARADVAAVRARGRVPLLVGGSGLYVRAVVDDLRFPGTDAVVRARWEAVAADRGPGALHAELARVDPVSAARIPAANVRRVVRALEATEVDGRPFSATLPTYAETGPLAPVVQVGLRVPRPVLDARITARVRRMADEGLVEEVRGLAGRGLREGRTASRALGYAQVLDHLDGRCTLEEALGATTAATRRYVRRQESWFHRDPRIHWLDAADEGGLPMLLAEALDVVAAHLAGRPPSRVALRDLGGA